MTNILAARGAKAVPVLLECLEHEEEKVRQSAPYWLGSLGIQAAFAKPEVEKLKAKADRQGAVVLDRVLLRLDGKPNPGFGSNPATLQVPATKGGTATWTMSVAK